jgi:hypothetical protein
MQVLGQSNTIKSTKNYIIIWTLFKTQMLLLTTESQTFLLSAIQACLHRKARDENSGSTTCITPLPSRFLRGYDVLSCRRG